MAGIHRFEDLIAWQKARELTRAVYDTTKTPPFANDYGLKGQIQRAAVSVMSNIAEGFERKGDKEFRQFLSIAKASCAEVRSLLYVATDVGYLSEDACHRTMELAQEVGRLIAGLKSRVSADRPRP